MLDRSDPPRGQTGKRWVSEGAEGEEGVYKAFSVVSVGKSSQGRVSRCLAAHTNTQEWSIVFWFLASGGLQQSAVPLNK